MRYLLLVILFAAPSVLAEVSLEDCAAIDSAVARLDCYDRIAGKQPAAAEVSPAGEQAPSADREPSASAKEEPSASAKEEPSAKGEPSAQRAPAAQPQGPGPRMAQDPQQPSESVTVQERPKTTIDDEPDADEEFGITLFGKRRGDPDVGQSVRSHIEAVRESAAGNRVMTLTNGQVWMEREAGRRRIDANQDVVITKRRWSYTMLLLDQNRRVTVQRID